VQTQAKKIKAKKEIKKEKQRSAEEAMRCKKKATQGGEKRHVCDDDGVSVNETMCGHLSFTHAIIHTSLECAKRILIIIICAFDAMTLLQVCSRVG